MSNRTKNISAVQKEADGAPIVAPNGRNIRNDQNRNGHAGKHPENFWGRQKRITRHRLWLLALIILYQIFVYPIGTALTISMETSGIGDSAMQNAVISSYYRQQAASLYLGLRQPLWMIPLVLGAVVAIAEFAYLFSMVKMDFYESQPISRRQRFADLGVNGALLFLIPQWVLGFTGILVAAGMGAMTANILAESVLALLFNTINFLAAYALGILSCTLCGNGIVAACLAGFFLLAEPLWKMMQMAMEQTYFVTNNTMVGLTGAYCTPVINAAAFMSRLQTAIGRDSITPLSALSGSAGRLLPCIVANVVITIVAFLLARLAFLRRKTESAGASILYIPVREAVKILIAATAAVLAGYVVNTVTGTGYWARSAVSLFLTILIMVAVGVIAAGVIQCIYEFNLRAFFHEVWSMLFAVALGSVVLAAFVFDLTGYDRYLPKKDQIAWASLSFYASSTSPYYQESDAAVSGGTSQDQYLSDNMKLTGSALEDLLAVAEEGQQNLVESSRSTSDEASGGYFCAVTYHLNNGAVKSRNILIPYDVDQTKMDNILKSQAYKETVYPIYTDDTVVDQYAEKGRLIYTNGLLQKEAQGTLYKEFKEAYRKDLDQYSFTLASTQMPVGYVSLSYSYDGIVSGNTAVSAVSSADINGIYINSMFEVYPEYTNTLNFLKENGIYLEPAAEMPQFISRITVANYNDDTQPEKTYTDQEHISAILSASAVYDMAPQWYPVSREISSPYTISCELNSAAEAESGTEESEQFSSNLDFYNSKVPEFIRTDVGKNVSRFLSP